MQLYTKNTLYLYKYILTKFYIYQLKVIFVLCLENNDSFLKVIACSLALLYSIYMYLT